MSDIPECCKSGFIWSGTPVGSIGKVGNLDAYISMASAESDSYIIILPDTFGHKLPNTQLIADSFAKAGFNCIVPDILNGEALSPVGMDNLLDAPKGFGDMISKTCRKIMTAPSFVPWMLRHNEKMVCALWKLPNFISPSSRKTMPFVEAVLEEIKISRKAKMVGVVGYCFGGRYSTICGADDRVNAIASIHPSMLSLPKDIIRWKAPSYFAFAEKDTVVPLSQAKTIEQAAKDRGVTAEVKVFKNMNHGFAVRGNEDLEDVMLAKNQCLQDIITFFNVHSPK
ncbi:hypothetical protein HDU67_000666 [Dinochytrium kinnereticum]|nr:hypothetical protein HDU67_000666 [Dinochytrium kinnereticum]